MENFEQAFNSFLNGCVKIYNEYMDQEFPTLDKEAFTVDKGRRYWRVVKNNKNHGGASVYVFVDTKSGDVLKAASWKAPAKHARGNIFDEHNGLSWIGPYGPAYLK